MTFKHKPNSWYIKMIHVAKNQLSMDDASYRQSLFAITAKRSCSNMNTSELSQVLEFMKSKGFKLKPKKKFSPKTSDKPGKTPLDKLRQLWIQMSHEGFIRDGSETALNKWAMNQSQRLNNGVAIEKLEWLTPKLVHALIEQLKQWHFRLIDKAFPSIYKEVLLLNQEDALNKNNRERFLDVVSLMKGKKTYVSFTESYSTLLLILKDHKKSKEQK